MVRMNPANLAKTIRAKLIEQSGLAANFVRNAASLYGTDLNKAGVDSVFSTITQTDVLLIFEIVDRETRNNVSYTENEDGKIVMTRAYTVKLTAYGNSAADTMATLVSRMGSAKVGDDLYAVGVYVEYFSHPSAFHEFINGSVWNRSDSELGIAIETEITQVNTGDRFTVVGDLDIIERS